MPQRQQLVEVGPQEPLQVTARGQAVLSGIAVNIGPEPREALRVPLGQGMLPQPERQHHEPLLGLLEQTALGRLDAEAVVHRQGLSRLQHQRRLVAWFCAPGWKNPMCMGTISRWSGDVLRSTTVP